LSGPRVRPAGHVPYRGLPRWQTVDMVLLDMRKGLAVLDVGCGTGYLLGKAAGRASLAMGVDLNQQRLRAARDGLLHAKRPNRGLIELAVADGQRLPFGDASFDRIICTETLEHVEDLRQTIRELARVLRPGGRLAVSVPHFVCEAILYRLIKDYYRFPGGHRRIFPPQALNLALARAGLQPYATCLRDSLEAAYWILFSLMCRPPRRFDAMLPGLQRWQARTRGQPYSRFYHAVDEVGNRFLPKSVVVYAVKPAGLLDERAS
jgi:SAM-dependent methyltransferase